MKKQIWALLKIAIIYVAVSIVLDAVLGGYLILLLLALACTFILFAAMILGVLWEQRAPKSTGNPERSHNGTGLSRLEHLCIAALDRGEAKAGETVSDRIRTIAFGAAAYHLNEPEAKLRAAAEQEPNLLRHKIEDEHVFQALTSDSLVRKGDWRSLDECLRRIED